jgi:hypothetical protein
MRGDERSRFCDTCRYTVVNLSAMTAEERRATLAAARASGERLCVTYFRRLNGEFVTPESPLSAAEKRSVLSMRMAAGLSVGAFALAASCLTADAAETLGTPPPATPATVPSHSVEETAITLAPFGMMSGVNYTMGERSAISRLIERKLGMQMIDLDNAPRHEKNTYVATVKSKADQSAHPMVVLVQKHLWYWEIVPGTLKPAGH